MKIEKGIYPQMGMEVYHAWKLDKANLKEGAISCSMLKAFYPNPYEWLKADEFKQTDAMKKGSIYDAALTDPNQLDKVIKDCYGISDDIVVAPFEDFKTKEARLWKELQSKPCISQNEYNKLNDAYNKLKEDLKSDAIHAVKKVHEHPIAGEIMKNAQFQVGVVGEIGGIPAKCLLDILPDADGDYCETIFDYKTIEIGLDDESIRKAIGKYKYHWQAAFYKSLFNKVHPDRVCSNFGFIFQSTKTHEVRVVMLSDDALCLGTKAIKQAVIEFTKCAHRGIRSRYLNTCDELDLMPYHAMNEDEALSIIEGGYNE